MKAYEQARAYENLRTWKLPLAYAVFVLIPVIFGCAAWHLGHDEIAEAQGIVAVFFVVVSYVQWRRLRVRHAGNVELLAEMEASYGDQLPWVQVDRHFAELEKVRREVEGS